MHDLRLSELVDAIDNDLLEIRENLDMHQFCAYWGAHDIFSYLRDCICLVHGTSGCMTNRRMLPLMGSSEPCDHDPHYSTAFTEQDVVFGGERKLAAAVSLIEARHRPALIAVITNCCADIIGDDVGGVVRSLGPLADKVVWLHTGGFSGKSYRKGSEEAFAALAKVMEEAPPVTPVPGSVNIFLRRWIWGENQVQEIEEIERLVTAMGLTVNAVMRKGITLHEFLSFRNAEANLSACHFFGMELFRQMEARFGTKAITESTPVGLDATVAWLHGLASTMGRTIPAALAAEIEQLRAERAVLRERIGSGRKAIVWTQTGERMIGMTKLAIDLGLEPYVVGVDAAALRDKIEMFKKEVHDGFNPRVVPYDTVEDVRALAKQLGDPVVLCNDDFFPEYDLIKYRYAQNQVYGLAGCRKIYTVVRDSLGRRRARFSFVSQVVPA